MRKPLGIASGLVVVTIATGFGLMGVNEEPMTEQARNLESEVIRIELAGQKFNVPMRYMYGQAIEKYHQWPKAKPGRVEVGALSLSVLLPALRPYYPEDDARWKVLGHGDRLEVSLMESISGSEGWYSFVRKGNLEGTAPGNPLRQGDTMGLMHFSASWTDNYLPLDEGLELKISCNFSGERNGRKGVSSPGCHVKSAYQPRIVLEYGYGLEYLPRWREIDNDLKAMFDQFARDAASESQSQSEQ